MRCFTTGVLAISLALASTPAASAQSPYDLLQQALVLEQAEGDLRGAITLYGRIAEQHGDERSVAAAALLHMGECYEKLGSSEARDAYRRLLEEYPDQSELAARAEVRLQALGRIASPAEPLIDEPSAVRTQLLWDGSEDPDVDAMGAPLPDGRALVYVDWDAANLAVRDLVTGESRLLTDDGTWDEEGIQAYPINAVVSTDGAEAAYSWVTYRYGNVEDHQYELRVVDLETGRQRTLHRGGERDQMYPFAWSPDGDRLLVGRYSGSGRDASVEIGTLPAAGGEFDPLKRYPRWFWVAGTFSPDGRSVVISRPVAEDSGRSDITLLPLDSGAELPLVTHPAHDQLLGWVPGTRQILFRSDRSGSWDLWALQIGAAGAEGTPRVVRRRIGEIDALGFSTDGTLFYSMFTRWFDLAVVPFDATTGQPDLDRGEPFLGSHPLAVWAPDGRQLAYIREVRRAGRDQAYELHVRDESTGEDRHLAPGLNAFHPSWAPDGSALVVTGSSDLGGSESLYRVNAETGEARQILEVPKNGRFWLGRAVWAPHDDAIVYTHYDRLVRRDLLTGEQTVLYQHPRLVGRQLARSRDGDWIAFGVGSPAWGGNPQENLAEGGRILLLRARGGEPRELTRITAPGHIIGNLAWGPNGDLYFLQRLHEGDRTGLWRAPLNGGDLELTWEVERRLRTLSIHPDGQRAAVSAFTQETQVWTFEGLLEALEEQN